MSTRPSLLFRIRVGIVPLVADLPKQSVLRSGLVQDALDLLRGGFVMVELCQSARDKEVASRSAFFP